MHRVEVLCSLFNPVFLDWTDRWCTNGQNHFFYPTLHMCMHGNSKKSNSLVPRCLRKGRRNAWYTLFAHALISKPISKNLWAIGYSGIRPSLMQSPTPSNSCKCLMSLLNPSSDRLWRPYMTGKMFSCGYLLATVGACVSKLYHSSWTSSRVS